MENPGLKRVGSPPPMTVPRTLSSDPFTSPVEALAPTVRQNVTTVPPATGVPSPDPASATNGAGPELNPAANRARIERAKMPGAGSSGANPAWAEAHQNIAEKVQQRRTSHPLHRSSSEIEEEWPGAWERNLAVKRGEIAQSGGSEHDNLVHFKDPQHRPDSNDMWGQHGDQPMISFKSQYHPNDPESVLDPGYHNPGQTCETCYLKTGDEESLTGEEHEFLHGLNHSFKPLAMEPGQRYSRVAGFDLGRNEFLYDIHTPNYHELDPPPSSKGSTAQPMFQEKDLPYEGYRNDQLPGSHDKDEVFKWDAPMEHPEHPACKGCNMRSLNWPDDAIHRSNSSLYRHDYEPYEETAPGARLAAQHPSEDPVYPYHPRPNPEHDTTDLDNMQSEDDSFRPHHPVVDSLMNQMQGLPDMTRNDPRLMDQVNSVLDQYPDTEEGNRGADALSMGLNTIFDSTNETKGLPREERLQRAKDAMDAHFETAQLTHKQHVKQLHEDWVARGGHKTGEPRPVERFSPRFTKPQQIVPDPSNPFPELESPIYHVGKCEGCGKNLFDSAGSSGSPLGAMGDHTVGTIDAAEYSPRGDTSGDRRMHGPSALICPGCCQESEKHNRILDKYQGHKAGDPTGDGHWGVPFGAPAGAKREFIPTTHYKDRKGKWHEPGEQTGKCYECDNGIEGFHHRNPDQPNPGKRTEASWGSFLRQAETDDEFWARQPDVTTGRDFHHLSPDAAGEDYEDYSDLPLDSHDDVVPENMSLRDHATLLRAPMRWDGSDRHPKYEREIWRNVTDSEGQRTHAQEGHVIQHNTRNTGPVLPTRDNPDPHVLAHPWSYSYYPAGNTGGDGWTKGHNTVDSALRDMHQLSLYGEDHPESQRALQGYKHIETEEPYAPTRTRELL